MKNKGFRIINLQVKNHYILKSNDFKFYDSNDNDVGPYFTVFYSYNRCKWNWKE